MHIRENVRQSRLVPNKLVRKAPPENRSIPAMRPVESLRILPVYKPHHGRKIAVSGTKQQMVMENDFSAPSQVATSVFGDDHLADPSIDAPVGRGKICQRLKTSTGGFGIIKFSRRKI